MIYVGIRMVIRKHSINRISVAFEAHNTTLKTTGYVALLEGRVETYR